MQRLPMKKLLTIAAMMLTASHAMADPVDTAMKKFSADVDKFQRDLANGADKDTLNADKAKIKEDKAALKDARKSASIKNGHVPQD